MYSCLGHQGWIKIIATAPLCPPSLYQISRHMTQTSQAFPSCWHTGIDQILEVAKTLQTHSYLPHNTLHSNSNLLSLLPRIENCQCSCGYIQQHCMVYRKDRHELHHQKGCDRERWVGSHAGWCMVLIIRFSPRLHKSTWRLNFWLNLVLKESLIWTTGFNLTGPKSWLLKVH